ncbi:MAG: hypothetical protein IKH39_08455 [Candidatus Methanomethylophilaceae archaeon]|nr:hypothetical protein [Candidatus Methanomethylophilaceae archaeon]
MDEVHFDTCKAYLSASQYRCRMERKLKVILGEDRIVGPLDPFIQKGIDKGLIDPEKGESLIMISKYCDSVFMATDREDFPTFKELKSWSDVIEALREDRTFSVFRHS